MGRFDGGALDLEEVSLVIEFVDGKEKIEAFVPLIDQAIHAGLATLEDAHIRFCRSRAHKVESR
jgi:PII-like signaling protein